MTKATITFDPYRMREALDQELGNHVRHVNTGTCACGTFTSKDPAKIREHLADAMLSVMLRFQGDVQPEPEDPEVEHWRGIVRSYMPALRSQYVRLPFALQAKAVVVVPLGWPTTVFGEDALIMHLPVRRGDVMEPEVHAPPNGPMLALMERRSR